MNTGPVEGWFYQMQKAMDVLDAQHKVIAGNIANVNTPAFHKLQMDFKSEMTRLLETEGNDREKMPLRAVPRGMNSDESSVEWVPATTQDTTTPGRPDGNNVRLENEMVDLAETNEVFSTLSRVAGKNLRMMRYVISGGRG